MSAEPCPRRITRASSLAPVACHPTVAPGLSRTSLLRIPAVCGAPFNNAQSPPGHASGIASGWGRGICDPSGSAARAAASKTMMIERLIDTSVIRDF